MSEQDLGTTSPEAECTKKIKLVQKSLDINNCNEWFIRNNKSYL